MIVTAGLGAPGGLLVSRGIGRIIAGVVPPDVDTGNGGSRPTKGRYQVTTPNFHIIKSPPKWRALVAGMDVKPDLEAQEVEIKTEHAVYPVSFEAIPTITQAMKNDRYIKEKVARAAKELGVSKRRARSVLRGRVMKEIHALRRIRDIHLDDDDLIEILLMAGII